MEAECSGDVGIGIASEDQRSLKRRFMRIMLTSMSVNQDVQYTDLHFIVQFAQLNEDVIILTHLGP